MQLEFRGRIQRPGDVGVWQFLLCPDLGSLPQSLLDEARQTLYLQRVANESRKAEARKAAAAQRQRSSASMNPPPAIKKIRGERIVVQKQSSETPEVLVPPLREPSPTRFVTVEALIQEYCPITEVASLLPQDQDPAVVRAILCALLKPATRDAKWGVNYREGRANQRNAKNLYWRLECRRLLPRGYQQSLEWLVKAGVVLELKKGQKDHTFSLQAKPGYGKSLKARELISLMHRVADKFREG